MIDDGAENARRRLFVVEALGPKSRELFIADFVENHPREYEGFYNHQSRGRDEDKVGRKGRGGHRDALLQRGTTLERTPLAMME